MKGSKVKFVKKWKKIYGDEASLTFLCEQYDLMKEGVRDVRIHDNTFYVWKLVGNELY